MFSVRFNLEICGRYEWKGQAVRRECNWPVSQKTLSESRKKDSGGHDAESKAEKGIVENSGKVNVDHCSSQEPSPTRIYRGTRKLRHSILTECFLFYQH